MIKNNNSLPDYSKYYQNALAEELLRRRIDYSVLRTFEVSSTEEKVRFVLKLNREFDLLPTQSMVVSKKDEIKAAAARKEGNQFFVKGDYLHALENYNKSLCLSDKGSENMGLTYANRSAVYFKTGYYETCLVNIELALENGYPEKMKPKLLKREENCLTAINNGKGKQMEPDEVDAKLSYKPNPKIPQIVEGIELAKNEKFGNHYVAKKNFNPRDVLMIEKPLVEYLELKKVYMYCLYCLKSNLLNLLPCEESTYVMFCSKSCYNEAMRKYFQYEGSILDAVYELWQEKSSVVIRLVLKLVTSFGNLDDLKEAFDRLTLNNFDPNTFDFQTATERDSLLAFCSFPAFEHNRTLENLFILTDWCANAFHLIKNYTGVGQLIQTKDHEATLMKILYQLILVEQIYGCGIHSVGSGSNFVQVKGSELSFVTSFLNHSCAPNVCRVGEHMNVVSAIRPIKAGEQLFMSYVKTHNYMAREERRMQLKSNFFFDCACEACEKNYPQLRNVGHINLPNEMKVWYSRPNVNLRQTADKKILKNVLDWASFILRKYDKYYPKEEILFRLIQTLSDCMFMLYSNKPLELAFN